MNRLVKIQELRLEITNFKRQANTAIFNGLHRDARFYENCIKDAQRQLKELKEK